MFSAHPFIRAGTVAAALTSTAIGASAATYDFESVAPTPFTGQAVPEANASLMLLAGLAVVGGLVRRRDR